MRAMTSLVSISALANVSAFIAPGHAFRSCLRGNAALRFMPRGHITSRSASSLRFALPRASKVRMSDSATTIAGEVKTEAGAAGELTELARLEIRVGKILEVSRHPDAENLYVEKIDIGDSQEQGPRTIVSGLVNFCSEADLMGRDVVVLCNLKPVNMKGITSAGMLLCSSNEEHTKVEPLCPPPDVPPGELVTFEGHASSPLEAGNRAVKAWKKVSKTLMVNEDKVAMFTGETLPAIFMTSRGPITSPLPGNIS